MIRFVLTLVFICLGVGLAQAQSNEVTLNIKLYPVQILEVNHDDILGFSKLTFTKENDHWEFELPDHLNTYSTSHFVLKVDLVRLFVPTELDKSVSEESIKPEKIDEVSHQVMYSIEAI